VRLPEEEVAEPRIDGFPRAAREEGQPERLVLGPDGTEDDRGAVPQLDLADEFLGIGPQRQVGVGAVRIFSGVRVADDPGVEGQDAFGRDEQGIDVELGDLGKSAAR